MKKYFFKSKEEVLKEFSVTEKGLTKEQAELSKNLYGVNELQEHEKEKAWVIFLSQFKDFLVIILTSAVSIIKVTGPSLINETFISAPNLPVSTFPIENSLNFWIKLS